jgi:competence protein ComEA
MGAKQGVAVKRNVAFVGCLLALGVVIGLLITDQIDQHRAPAIVIEDPRLDAEIVVSVEGAVVSPGTYSLTFDARVQHALDAAGGPTSDADLTGMNLAQRLRDEDRLIVPTLAQDAAGSPQSEPVGLVGQTPTALVTNLINVNTADAATLESLPRIGEVLAAAIIAYREANGPFGSVEELALVDGISLGTVDEIRQLITV